MMNRNAEGYIDPTAGDAINSLEKEEKRYKKLVKIIFALCDLAGYHVEILSVRDKRTGKIWR